MELKIGVFGFGVECCGLAVGIGGWDWRLGLAVGIGLGVNSEVLAILLTREIIDG